MVALIFSILGFLACAFLIYVLAQFHRELMLGRGLRRPHVTQAVIVMMMPPKRAADIARAS
jgi:hypothetical protein